MVKLVLVPSDEGTICKGQVITTVEDKAIPLGNSYRKGYKQGQFMLWSVSAPIARLIGGPPGLGIKGCARADVTRGLAKL